MLSEASEVAVAVTFHRAHLALQIAAMNLALQKKSQLLANLGAEVDSLKDSLAKADKQVRGF